MAPQDPTDDRPGTPKGPSRSRGRPRDAQKHEAVLEATRVALRSTSYGQLRLDEIARVAGVSRGLIYQRWGHEARLVEEALFPTSEVETPDTGSLVGDLTEMVASMVALYSRPEVALYSEGIADPDLLSTEATMAAFSAPWDTIVERARDRDELPAAVKALWLQASTAGSVAMLLQSGVSGEEICRHLGRRLLNGLS